MDIIKGQRIKVLDSFLNIKCDIIGKNNNEMDMCLFGVDENNHLEDDRYFIINYLRQRAL